MHDNNSMDRFDSEGHSSGFDRLLTLFPPAPKREADACSEASSYSYKDEGATQPPQTPKQEEGAGGSGSTIATPSPSVTTSPAVNMAVSYTHLTLPTIYSV